MPIDPKTLRPKAPATGGGPDTDPPVQLKAENNSILITEAGDELVAE